MTPHFTLAILGAARIRLIKHLKKSVILDSIDYYVVDEISCKINVVLNENIHLIHQTVSSYLLCQLCNTHMTEIS